MHGILYSKEIVIYLFRITLKAYSLIVKLSIFHLSIGLVTFHVITLSLII